MNEKQLLEIINSLKHEILDLLLNTNMNNDRAAKRTLSIINNTFDRLGLLVEDVIPKELLVSYFGGVDEAASLLKAAGVNPIGGLSTSITASGTVAAAFNTHVHLNALAEITDETMRDFKAAIRTAKRNTNISINKALKSVKEDLKSGIIKGNARTVITQRVAESFAKEGMISFITSDLRELPLDFYSMTVTRTNIKRANVDGALNRYTENGVDLVQIFERVDGCAECAKFNGMVVSLSGNHPDYPNTQQAPLPPRHPNCRGSIRPYMIQYKTGEEVAEGINRWKSFEPAKDTRSKANKEAYNNRQNILRKRNAEKKQYANYKAVLGEDAPKTLGGFRRSKTSQSDNFVKMQKDYRDALKTSGG